MKTIERCWNEFVPSDVIDPFNLYVAIGEHKFIQHIKKGQYANLLLRTYRVQLENNLLILSLVRADSVSSHFERHYQLIFIFFPFFAFRRFSDISRVHLCVHHFFTSSLVLIFRICFAFLFCKNMKKKQSAIETRLNGIHFHRGKKILNFVFVFGFCSVC